MLPAGCYIFWFAVARPASRLADEGDFVRFAGQLDRIVWWSLPAILLTGALWLCAEAVSMSGEPLAQALSPSVLGTVLSQTLFGQLWQIRAGLLFLFACCMVLPGGSVRLASLGHALGLLLSIALVCSLAWAGHAASVAGDEGKVLLASQLVHLLAASGWLGGLLPLVMVLSSVDPAQSKLTFAAAATHRFSTLGVVCVGALLLSGSVNGLLLVGSVPALLGTSYGHLLLIKLALLAAMLSFAVVNRQRLSPALDRDDRAAVRSLVRNALIETALGLVILLVAGILSATAPAVHEQPDWPFPFALSTVPLERDATLWLAVATAGVLAALSLAAAAYGFRVRRRWTGRIGIVGLLVSTIAGGQLFAVPAYPTSFMQSPVGYAAPAIADGARLYDRNCAACHGASGRGDGPAAASLDRKPSNLTAAHLFHHSPGTLFWWIGNGIPDKSMPAFGGQIDVAGRWDLVQFLRAQNEAQQGSTLGAAVEPFSGLVAPDFAFQIAGGRQQTLKALRGKAIVHLVLYSLPQSLDRLRQIAAASSELGKSGVQIIALPIGDSPQPLDLPTGVGILAASDANTVETYLLYRRLPDDASPSLPKHAEFLIDRAGYLRARWIPSSADGWADLSRLKEEIERLSSEPLRPPAPEGHVHG